METRTWALRRSRRPSPRWRPTFPHLVIKSDSLVAYGHTAVDVGTSTQHPATGGELVSHYLVVLRRGAGPDDWRIVRLAVVPVTPMKM